MRLEFWSGSNRPEGLDTGVMEYWSVGFRPITPSFQIILHSFHLSRSTFSKGPFSRNGSGQPRYSLKSGRALIKS